MALVIVTCNGAPLAGWIEVEVEQAFDKAAGHCTVTMSELPGVPLPMHVGDKAQVLIDGRPVITGFVHEIHGDLSLESHGGSHKITATVRDQTQDMIDSTVGPKLKLKSPINLKDITRKTLDTMGLSHIGVIDHINPEQYKQGEQISAAIDDRGFNFLDQWAQKRQVLFNTDGKGNLCIDRNRKQRGPGVLWSHYEDDPRNNVKKSSYRNSDLNRHNTTAINGQKSTTDKDWWQSRPKGDQPAQATPLQKNWGTATDSDVRPQRRIHGRGAKGLSGTSPSKSAKWRSSEAKARGFQYTATVSGFYGGGMLWWPGFIIMVSDQHWELEAELFISNVKFKKSWDGGETTEIACTYPDAFTDKGADSSLNRGAKLGAGASKGGFSAPSSSDMGLD